MRQIGEEVTSDSRDPFGFIPRHVATFKKNLFKFGLCSNWIPLMQKTIVLARKTDQELHGIFSCECCEMSRDLNFRQISCVTCLGT